MTNAVSVAWIHGSSTLPSTRIRCQLIMQSINNDKFRVTEIDYCKDDSAFDAIATSLERYDVVIIQKQLLPRSRLNAIRMHSKRLIFDFDDAIHVRQEPRFGSFLSLKRHFRFRAIMAAADRVIAGNEILADTARHYGARSIDVLPSGVPVDVPCAEPRLKPPTSDDPLVLGWVGTKPNIPYLELWADVFAALARGGAPIKVRVISDIPPPLEERYEREFVKWDAECQDALVADFDLGLMPLPDNPWTRGKCAYKALQAMAACVPVLASDVGVTKRWIGSAGRVVSRPEDVAAFIREIINAPHLLVEMGKEGRRIVLERFSLQRVASDLERIIYSEVAR